ncbi:hypothetical protein [Streptomyces noursei]|uniref:hypothetical protein n=1 Tax=Streptomyces noursei TaxID=1971 RepID=UPI0023B7F531|nr:hypothetical protein [Streptomyces noursei]
MSRAEGQAQLAEWLTFALCGVELNSNRLESTTPRRIARLVGSALSTFEERFREGTVGWLSAATRSRRR